MAIKKTKNWAAAALGRKGGLKSRSGLGEVERLALAKKAAASRWKKELDPFIELFYNRATTGLLWLFDGKERLLQVKVTADPLEDVRSLRNATEGASTEVVSVHFEAFASKRDAEIWRETAIAYLKPAHQTVTAFEVPPASPQKAD